MKRYIFITPEGLTYKPNCDSPEPDFVDMQIIGFGQGPSVQDALKDLIELHENALENKFDRPFSIRMENDSKKYFWIRENIAKTSLAS